MAIISFDLADFIDFELLLIKSSLEEISLVYQLNKTLTILLERTATDWDLEIEKKSYFFNQYNWIEVETAKEIQLIKNQSNTKYFDKQMDIFSFENTAPYIVPSYPEYTYVLKIKNDNTHFIAQKLKTIKTIQDIHYQDTNTLETISYLI